MSSGSLQQVRHSAVPVVSQLISCHGCILFIANVKANSLDKGELSKIEHALILNTFALPFRSFLEKIKNITKDGGGGEVPGVDVAGDQ